MKKRILGLVLALSMLFSMVVVPAYVVSSGTCGGLTGVTIPDSVTNNYTKCIGVI